MEYGYHVVHYAAPSIDMYIAEPAGRDPLPEHWQRLGEVFYDGTQSMCADFLDDLYEEIGGERLSVGGQDSLVLSVMEGRTPPRRAGMTYGPVTGA